MYMLIHAKTKYPVHVGDTLPTFNGKTVKVLGTAPKTGRVIIEFSDGHTREVPAFVINTVFINVNS